MNFAGSRYWSVVALLAGAAFFLATRADSENLPARKRIADFPLSIGDWRGRTVEIQPDILEILGNGEFASRFYVRRDGEPPIDFFLAYFASQRTGDTLHSPQNCLPGSGWSPLEHARVPLELAPGNTITVNRYIIAKGLDRQVVLYWYQAHGRAVASEYAAKVYLVADAIRLNRTDGAMIRIISPVGRGEEIAAADARTVAFAQAIAPLLPEFVPN